MGQVSSASPTNQSSDAWALGRERGHEDGQGGGAVLVPADRGQVRGLVVPVHRGARVHHGHVEHEQRVGDADQLRVCVEAITNGEHVDREQHHLHEHQRALHGAVVAIAIGVEGRRHPDQEHRREGGVDSTDPADVRLEADGITERDHRGHEHEVVEELQPADRARALPYRDVVVDLHSLRSHPEGLRWGTAARRWPAILADLGRPERDGDGSYPLA